MRTQINETNDVENLKEEAGEIDKETATKKMSIQPDPIVDEIVQSRDSNE